MEKIHCGLSVVLETPGKGITHPIHPPGDHCQPALEPREANEVADQPLQFRRRGGALWMVFSGTTPTGTPGNPQAASCAGLTPTPIFYLLPTLSHPCSPLTRIPLRSYPDEYPWRASKRLRPILPTLVSLTQLIHVAVQQATKGTTR